MKNLSSSKGLSLSQASSISNLCNQRATEITRKITNLNNSSKSFTLDGKNYVVREGKSIPSDVVDLLKERASLHAAQAFIMEALKEKEAALKAVKSKQLNYTIPYPVYPDLKEFINELSVDETWGWNQLSASEKNEYLEQEAYASSIGKFFHKGSELDDLREDLAKSHTFEWMEVPNSTNSYPVDVTKHHTSEELLKIHEELAEIHRGYEQRVNYYKAKVKNLVTDENARIAKDNATKQKEVNKENSALITEYNAAMASYNADYLVAVQEFENDKNNKVKELSGLKISVDSRFQAVIDIFLKKVNDGSEE